MREREGLIGLRLGCVAALLRELLDLVFLRLKPPILDRYLIVVVLVDLVLQLRVKGRELIGGLLGCVGEGVGFACRCIKCGLQAAERL